MSAYDKTKKEEIRTMNTDVDLSVASRTTEVVKHALVVVLTRVARAQQTSTFAALSNLFPKTTTRCFVVGTGLFQIIEKKLLMYILLVD